MRWNSLSGWVPCEGVIRFLLRLLFVCRGRGVRVLAIGVSHLLVGTGVGYGGGGGGDAWLLKVGCGLKFLRASASA